MVLAWEGEPLSSSVVAKFLKAIYISSVFVCAFRLCHLVCS